MYYKGFKLYNIKNNYYAVDTDSHLILKIKDKSIFEKIIDRIYNNFILKIGNFSGKLIYEDKIYLQISEKDIPLLKLSIKRNLKRVFYSHIGILVIQRMLNNDLKKCLQKIDFKNNNFILKLKIEDIEEMKKDVINFVDSFERVKVEISKYKLIKRIYITIVIQGGKRCLNQFYMQ